jgi:pSer/pThr/pTyr-binding forkhead associated (FHA) protein
MIRLRILSGRQAGAERQISEFPCTVGRSKSDDIRVEDAGVWDKHLTITYEPGEGCSVSRNPRATALLNRGPLDEGRLRSGDELEIGAVRIRFRLSDPVQRDLRNRERLAWALIATLAVAQLVAAVVFA